MKTLRIFVAICLAVVGFFLSRPTEAREMSTVKRPGLQAITGLHLVWFADDRLTARVQDVPLGRVLDEIARTTGLTVVRHVALDQPVSAEFYQLSLERGLRRILRHRSFVLEYALSRPRTLWILPQGEEEHAFEHRIVERTDTTSFGKDIAQISTLEATLKGGDAEQREEAALALGESGHAHAVAPLTLALADEDEDVREAAVVSLAEIGGAEAVQALVIALRDENPRVREEAVDALGEIGGPMAIGLLEQALTDEVKFVRQAATEVLDELRQAAQ